MFVFGGKSWFYQCVAILASICQSLPLRAPALVPYSPFLSIWNAPTEQCLTHHKTSLNFRLFQLVGSPKKTATNQAISMFYHDRLGYYPYIDEVTGESINGGIPQFIPFTHHLRKAAADIRHYIPSEQQAGLAVIDWEEWRPSWVRNWASKTMYKKHSVQFVQLKNRSLTAQQAHSIARTEFEKASKTVMQQTLILAEIVRPYKQWGFFLFPECYNYDYNQNPNNYTGRCPDIEKQRNDELWWLWRTSSALYPSIYLESALKSTPNAALYSRHRIQEAKRVSTARSEHAPLPIYLYTRPVFTDDPLTFLTQVDLVNTIGESAALGVSGVVMWGDLSFAKNVRTCRTLDKYMKHVLNPYIVNVTLAAKMCSQVLCHGKGACTRKNWNANSYLHLNPQNFTIRKGRHRKISVIGHPTMADFLQMAEEFECSCYSGNTDCHRKGRIQIPKSAIICISGDICIQAIPGFVPGSILDNQFKGKTKLWPTKTSYVWWVTVRTPSSLVVCIFLCYGSGSSPAVMYSPRYVLFEVDVSIDVETNELGTGGWDVKPSRLIESQVWMSRLSVLVNSRNLVMGKVDLEVSSGHP
ncbi:hyaluronidase PH-20-like [Ambystoma mexicanum]|uniref:hyaluronidase PH-20-like n=1 Tax=Ambystoma mexicanum TaxID=8296 RepID=UPI0037E94B47